MSWSRADRGGASGSCTTARAWKAALINHKRLHRVYCALKLNLPRRTKRRLPTRLRQPLLAPLRLNKICALDFMADTLYSSRSFRTFNVIDEGIANCSASKWRTRSRACA
jgi:hypothetical protein